MNDYVRIINGNSTNTARAHFMRRSPKALEKERRLTELIAVANSSSKPSEGTVALIGLIEDPSYRTAGPPVGETGRHDERQDVLTTTGDSSIDEPDAKNTIDFKEFTRKIRPAIVRQQDQLFRRW